MFVAIDGEAIGRGPDARYCLLASSRNKFIWNIDGLPTTQCFEFLLSQQEKGDELVVFGLGYDVNQWLRDVPEPTLRELWQTGTAFFKHYKLVWTVGRRFEVYCRKTKRWAIVQEVFGFFQQAFVKALTAWGIPVPTDMELWKKARGTFTEAEKQGVISYCFGEVAALVELMDKLKTATQTAGCTPRPHWWIGAGQLASRLLANQGVREHHRHDADLADERGLDAIMRAYFGGRAELLRQGERSNVRTFDLRSAYPWGATHLPSLANAKLRRRQRFDPNTTHGIARVTWHALPGHIMPFPVRVKQAIYYPRSGTGWYHAVEIRAALAAGCALEIGEGYELQVDPKQTQPFAFIPDAFKQRRAWQKANHPAEKALKLALNSLYGKTAQGVAGNGQPKWQSYLWAGEMTARTRAALFTLATKATDPMMIATDGLFCARAPAKASTKIGGWEHGELGWLFTAQAGVYHGLRRDGTDMLKSRGFFVSDIDYAELHHGWQTEGPDYVHAYTSNRFIGLGQVIGRKPGSGLGQWRQFIDQERRINLRPQRKVLVRDTRYGGYRCEPVEAAPGESEPYTPKRSLLESGDDDNAAGMEQPLRITL